MEMTFACPKCEAVNRLGGVESAASATCAGCGHVKELYRTAFDGEGTLCSCPFCATEDLYIQKDFPQNLGVTIVVVGFIVSSVFWYLERPLVTYAILLASALLDMLGR